MPTSPLQRGYSNREIPNGFCGVGGRKVLFSYRCLFSVPDTCSLYQVPAHLFLSVAPLQCLVCSTRPLRDLFFSVLAPSLPQCLPHLRIRWPSRFPFTAIDVPKPRLFQERFRPTSAFVCRDVCGAADVDPRAARDGPQEWHDGRVSRSGLCLRCDICDRVGQSPP